MEAIRRTKNALTLVFASTSTVYGEASRIPTPEDYAPLLPISVYGASKLACETLITAYAYIRLQSYHLPLSQHSCPRSRHGVIHDFIRKLKKNPEELEILGDEAQTKSYLYVSDCVEAMLLGLKKEKRVDVFNIGSEDQMDVKAVAEVVIEEMVLRNVKLTFTGGVDGGRGG